MESHSIVNTIQPGGDTAKMNDLNKTDEYWMIQALEQARFAQSCGEIPVGAVIVAGDKLLGVGYNRAITAVDPSAHAEIEALRAAAHSSGNYRLPGTTLYVTIEPCTMCVGAMIHARIDRLVYGASEPRAGAVESNLSLLGRTCYNHSIAVKSGVLADQCGGLIRDFFRKKRNAAVEDT